MKNLIYILILFTTLSCKKVEILVPIVEPTPTGTSATEFTDGDEFIFVLTQPSECSIELINTMDGNVISKELIKGVKGSNSFNIYTKVLQVSSLTLVIKDSLQNEIINRNITIK